MQTKTYGQIASALRLFGNSTLAAPHSAFYFGAFSSVLFKPGRQSHLGGTAALHISCSFSSSPHTGRNRLLQFIMVFAG